jgi:hypothetical protein
MEVSGLRRASILGVVASVAALVAAMALAASSSAVTVTTLASGLDNPRDLAFDSDGDLFVAEAGHGSEPAGKECVSGGPGGPEESLCAGFTSGVSELEGGVAHRVVSGQVSLAGADGTAATGIDGISILDDWRIFSVETESEFAVPPAGFSQETIERAKAQLGRLDENTRGAHSRVIANVGAFDFNWSNEKEHKELVPEQFPDANPYAVLATNYGYWVADAASNTIDWVSNSGSIKVVAFIPNPEKEGHPVSDAVPTCIDRGPDGALYVGELTGGGNGPGASTVWRLEPWDGDLSKWATGLTAVTGCGFDSDGDFYAVEFSTLGFESFAPGTGALVRVPPHSTSPVPVVPGLSFPGGFAARGDSVYFSNWSIAPAQGGPGGASGQVMRAVVEEEDSGYGSPPPYPGQGHGHHGQGDGGHGHNGHHHYSRAYTGYHQHGSSARHKRR